MNIGRSKGGQAPVAPRDASTIGQLYDGVSRSVHSSQPEVGFDHSGKLILIQVKSSSVISMHI